MIHPDTELRFINEQIGYGVVAKEFIPRGTITWTLDKLDREFTPKGIKNFSATYKELLEKYCYRNNKGNYILCWDIAKYINHSFKSNCVSTAYEFEIAVKDIHPGEQLTDDYGYLNVSEPFTPVDEGTERKVVYPDDLLNFYKYWDKQIEDNISKILLVEQPLKYLFEQNNWNEVEKLATGKKAIRSIKNCYYDGS